MLRTLAMFALVIAVLFCAGLLVDAAKPEQDRPVSVPRSNPIVILDFDRGVCWEVPSDSQSESPRPAWRLTRDELDDIPKRDPGPIPYLLETCRLKHRGSFDLSDPSGVIAWMQMDGVQGRTKDGRWIIEVGE